MGKTKKLSIPIPKKRKKPIKFSRYDFKLDPKLVEIFADFNPRIER